MKNKFKVLPLLVCGLALSSCSFNDFYATVTEIHIEQEKTRYLLGDIYLEQANLQILATYSNGKEAKLRPDQVDVIMTNKNDNYSAYHPFEISGNYKVTVGVGLARSNTLEFIVYDEPVYATNVELDISKTSLKTMETSEITVNITPNDYNLELEYEVSRESAKLKKTGERSFEFVESKSGQTTVTFKARSGESDTDFISGTYTFDVEASAEEREIAQTYKDLASRNSPTVGEVNYLVIPLWLEESGNYIKSNKKDLVRSDIQKAYFGTESETGWHSVSSFYKNESGEKFILSGTVSEWYESGLSIDDVKSDDEYGSNTATVANNAVDWYFSTHKKDNRKNYDSDGDGYIDGLTIIYGVPDYNATNVDSSYRENRNLWAFCASTGKTANVEIPNVNLFFWASYDFMYGLSAAIERTGTNIYKGNNAHNIIDTHTYIHETGHIFGLDDYYDYSGQACPAGGFSMQDYNVGGHDPYSVMALGWANPYIPTESCKIQLNSFQKSKELILLTPSWNEFDSPFDEYLLLELYTPEELNYVDATYRYGDNYPQGPTIAGVRLWHVDARLSYRIIGTEYSQDLTTNAKLRGGMVTAFSNTNIKSSINEPHVTPLAKYGRNYAEYNLLSLIRNNKGVNYKPTSKVSNRDLFRAGDEFTIEDYKLQFPYQTLNSSEEPLLDSGIALGWTFNIESISNGSAVINVTKL